jgi:hypothetical protein
MCELVNAHKMLAVRFRQKGSNLNLKQENNEMNFIEIARFHVANA